MQMFVVYMTGIYVLGVALLVFLKLLFDGRATDGMVEWIKCWSGLFVAGLVVMAGAWLFAKAMMELLEIVG